MNNSVLLVGANGFIGSHCLKALQAAGYDVYPTYRSQPPHQADWFALDIFDSEAVAGLMADLRPKYMINCAWYVAHGLFWHADVNADYVDATRHLYRMFSENDGARAVFLGTGAECVSNDASRGGNTLYARAKRETALMLNQARHEGGASYLWARLYALYGMGEPSQRFIPYVISCYLRGEAPVVQNPHLSYNFTYAPNLALLLTDQLQKNLEGEAACVMDDTVNLADMASYIHQTFFPDGPAPLIAVSAEPAAIFAPAVDDKSVEFAHLDLLSRYDALNDYIARFKDSAHGM